MPDPLKVTLSDEVKGDTLVHLGGLLTLNDCSVTMASLTCLETLRLPGTKEVIGQFLSGVSGEVKDEGKEVLNRALDVYRELL